MLSLHKIAKSFSNGSHQLEVLSEISLRFTPRSSTAVVGPSGSGKTTLLGLCAGLDTPTSGSIELNGEPFSSLEEDQRARLRSQYIGFVFQNFQLIPTLTALENICVPMELQGQRNPHTIAMEWLERVGLKDRAKHYPVQLSGGEQQRVAIARASATQPKILFADEPTGNLDGSTGEQIENLLFEAHRNTRNTLIIVTHDLQLAKRADRIIRLKNGKIVQEENA
jgi:putative ABC transport system ATP-binding protein